jgi:hypothetical protein
MAVIAQRLNLLFSVNSTRFALGPQDVFKTHSGVENDLSGPCNWSLTRNLLKTPFVPVGLDGFCLLLRYNCC